MGNRLVHGDVLDVLPTLGVYDCCFMDPPDGIGLELNGYQEAPPDYMNWLAAVLECAIPHSLTTWVSYNAIWDLAIKSWAFDYQRHHDVTIRPFVQIFTFGQNRQTDCGNGHRPVLRIMRPGAPLYPEQIKVPSWRELNGDKRAAKGGRVPLDHWDYPRVTGNSKQRRPHHPTQLNEGLVERAIKMSTHEGGTVLDLFSGTGTALRVCSRINRTCTSVEANRLYCEKIAEEHNLQIVAIKTSSQLDMPTETQT